MDRIIIHVDMDAFYAAVEVRDNPELKGRPLIIGALPHERGVVATCSYEARRYGVRSAMSIKQAYRLCPDGIYMHPNMWKYREASSVVHGIWGDFTDRVEYVSLDEGYLDVTGSAHLFGGAGNIALKIKQRVRDEAHLTCSVGIGYSMMTAKLASEEKKPDGLFEILSPPALKELIMERSVRVIFGVGVKTAIQLEKIGVFKVKDIYPKEAVIKQMLGKQGVQIIELANGIDEREVIPYQEPKSIGKEHTFQKDIGDFNYLDDVLLLIAGELSFDIRQRGIYCHTVTLKVTYGNMKQITRSKTGDATNKTNDIYKTAKDLLEKIEKKPVRLIGIALSGLAKTAVRQVSLLDGETHKRGDRVRDVAFSLQQKFGKDAIKTGNEFGAIKRLRDDPDIPVE